MWIAIAGLALRTLSFARLARFAAAPPRPSRGDPSDMAAAETIGRAVEAAARRAPWPVLCFEKGLAAHAMLRRRGRPSILHYGARTDALRGLAAHVWVTLAGFCVVGGAEAAGFAILACFPSQGPVERGAR